MRSKGMSLWVGAGISSPSLPLGNELKFCILENICSHAALRQYYNDRLQPSRDIGREIRNLPFEWIVQVLTTLDPSILDSIVRVCQGGSPNKNHLLIAKLMRCGFVSQVVTTNLDLLIERVLEADLGWRRGVDFNLFSNESQFKRVNSISSLPSLFKIHGSADDASSVRITLDNVASRILSEGRARVLERFLASGDVLVLGYRARDDFDINPILSKIQLRGRIFYVNHVRKGVTLGGLPRAFSKFTGSSIRCDTEKVVDYLWKSVLNEHRNHPHNRLTSKVARRELAIEDWREIIEGWAKQLQLSKRYLILGSILLEKRRSDSYQLFSKARKACIDDRNYPGLATALYSLGMIEQEKGRYQKAREFFDQTLRIDRRLGDRRGVAVTLRLIAKIHLDTGNLAKASKLFHEAADIFYKLGDLSEFAMAVEDLAVLELDKENYPRAAELFSQVKEVFEKSGNLSGLATVLQNLAIVEDRRGNSEEASKLCREALDIASKLSDQPEIAFTLHHLGTLEQSKGNYATARRFYDQALEIRRTLTDRSGLASTTSELARLEVLTGNYKDARVLYKKAKRIFQRLGHPYGVAKCLQELAMADVYEGRYRRATRLTNQSLKMWRQMPDESAMAAVLDQLGTIELLRGNLVEAKAHCQEALQMFHRLHDQRGIAVVLHNLATIYEEKGELTKAIALYRRSLKIKRRIKDHEGIAKTLHQLGVIEQRRHNYDSARRYYQRSLRIKQRIGDLQGIATTLHDLALIGL
jgi:tetratricopeptide (TPR) repeat protein